MPSFLNKLHCNLFISACVICLNADVWKGELGGGESIVKVVCELVTRNSKSNQLDKLFLCPLLSLQNKFCNYIARYHFNIYLLL